MATFPAFVQLLRLLGRPAALAALGVESEPEPDTLSDEQRERLRALVAVELESIAAQLVDEAAASDDVLGAAGARTFVRERLAGVADLLEAEQVSRLLALTDAATADWG